MDGERWGAMREVEFWPDYGGALLHEEGRRLELRSLDLSSDLVAALDRWLGLYGDEKLDPATRDAPWIEAGRQLFERLREELRRADIELIDWEGYWDAAQD
jgi:hypothetical protein